MKIPKLFPRKKLRATTARRSLGAVDYDEMSEPNMKLSRALLIVLVLHVVAVAGIIAFNSIKTRPGAMPPPPLTASINRAKTQEPDPAKIDSSPDALTNVPANARHDETKPAHPPARVAGREERKADHAKATDSGKTYVVAKGDTPVSIAKKLKVSYDELLALNHIDDPHKLQIGQKLIVPAKTTKGKKADG